MYWPVIFDQKLSFVKLIQLLANHDNEYFEPNSSVGNRLTWNEELDICGAGVFITQQDIKTALQHMQTQQAQTLGVPKVIHATRLNMCMTKCCSLAALFMMKFQFLVYSN